MSTLSHSHRGAAVLTASTETCGSEHRRERANVDETLLDSDREAEGKTSRAVPLSVDRSPTERAEAVAPIPAGTEDQVSQMTCPVSFAISPG